jgi:hypothetical protein
MHDSEGGTHRGAGFCVRWQEHAEKENPENQDPIIKPIPRPRMAICPLPSYTIYKVL